MKSIFSICVLMVGSALLLGGAPSADEQSALNSGYDTAIADLRHHWWDPDNDIPRIRPTRGGNSSPTSCDVGMINNNARRPSFWQMTHFANVQYWNWKITHSPAMKAEIKSEWRYLHNVYTDDEIASGGKSAGIVNVSDDAAWELNYLMQIHDVTGYSLAMDDARALLRNTLAGR